MKSTTQDLIDEGPGAVEVLRELRSATDDPERLRRAVVDAEVLDFDPDEVRELLGLLRDFISTHRRSMDPDDVTVIGSAIRTLIAVAPMDGLACIVHELLDPAAEPSLRMEITTAKMIVRKLLACPTPCVDHGEVIERCLLDLVDRYLDVATIETRGHGAVTLDAILGLTLLGTLKLPTTLDRLSSFDARWFRELVAWEAEALAMELRKSPLHASRTGTIVSLEEVAAAAAPAITE